MKIFKVVNKLRNVILAYGVFTIVLIFTWLNYFHREFNERPIVTDRELFDPLLIDSDPVKMNPNLKNAKALNIPMKSQSDRISQIIHLVATWENGSAPLVTERWIMSWRAHNPHWQILIWSKEAARKLIDKAHPELLSLYDSYPQELFRADVIRYVILYHYGGVYADIDMECLKPLDTLMDYYRCIVSQEPDIHRVFLHRSSRPYLTDAFMACHRGHPFFKQILDNLPQHNQISRTLPFPESSFQATGPKMLQKEFWKYELSIRANLSSFADDVNNVDVPPAEYFHPRTDGDMTWRCSDDPDDRDTMTEDEVALCDRWRSHGYRNAPTDESYTDHHWLHSYNDGAVTGFRKVTDMLSTAEDAVYYV